VKSVKPQIYDSLKARLLSLTGLTDLYRSLGVSRVFFKKLAANDNSKNQIYLAGHFTDLGFIPTSELIPSDSSSVKTNDPKRKVKFTAELKYRWISCEGELFPSASAKLIYYPQFPEVRLSGFVVGCKFDMAGWMDPNRKGRTQGRILFFGVRNDGVIFAYLAVPESRLSKEINDAETLEISGVLGELPLPLPSADQKQNMAADEEGTYLTDDLLPRHKPLVSNKHESKNTLLNELRRIHLKGPIAGKRLNNKSEVLQCTASNGGGYTLEAELGITPNGYAEPDFHGWEIKQFGVERCDLINSKPLTVMTPEPNGGYYVEQGVDAFIRKYGYQSPNDRLDFTGRHFMGTACEKSGLTLTMPGFDCESCTMTDAQGFIGLADSSDNFASKWTFSKLLQHWKRKHAKAAYVPSVANIYLGNQRAYRYCNVVRLFEGTDIVRLLSAFAQQAIYYDPGINMKFASTKPIIKRRSQFRIKSSSLKLLYQHEETIDLLKYCD